MKDRDFILKQLLQERTVARVACLEMLVRRARFFFFKLSFGLLERTCSFTLPPYWLTSFVR